MQSSNWDGRGEGVSVEEGETTLDPPRGGGGGGSSYCQILHYHCDTLLSTISITFRATSVC